MSDPEFVPGLFVKPPHPRAPEFVRASVSIKREELAEWLSARSDEWINIDVKESRGGKWYAQVSTYKPKDKETPKPAPAAPSGGGFEDFDNDIPFLNVGRNIAGHSFWG